MVVVVFPETLEVLDFFHGIACKDGWTACSGEVPHCDFWLRNDFDEFWAVEVG